MKLTPDDRHARMEYLDEVRESFPGFVEPVYIEDYKTFDLFKYEAQYRALVSSGMRLDLFPSTASSKVSDRLSLERLFSSFLNKEDSTAEAIFSKCSTIREKIARVTELTETQLLLIRDDHAVPNIVRKYAEAILGGEIDELHKILDQAWGKPLEQRVTLHQEVSSLAGLSTDELRLLLASSEEPIEVEAIIEEGNKDEE